MLRVCSMREFVSLVDDFLCEFLPAFDPQLKCITDERARARSTPKTSSKTCILYNDVPRVEHRLYIVILCAADKVEGNASAQCLKWLAIAHKHIYIHIHNTHAHISTYLKFDLSVRNRASQYAVESQYDENSVSDLFF